MILLETRDCLDGGCRDSGLSNEMNKSLHGTQIRPSIPIQVMAADRRRIDKQAVGK